MWGLGDDTATTTPTLGPTLPGSSVVLTPDQLATLIHPTVTSGETFSDFLGSHVTGSMSLTTLVLILGAAGLVAVLVFKSGGHR